MAIFGDVGKFLGLGTAKQTLRAGAQGALRGAISGQPFMGAGLGALTAGTQQGQSTAQTHPCLLYTSPSPRDRQKSRMPSSA